MEINILNTIGLGIALVGTIILTLFGVRFHGNELGVNIRKHLTNEQWQRLGFSLLLTGFLFQLIAQFL
jgi:hypothetical protein